MAVCTENFLPVAFLRMPVYMGGLLSLVSAFTTRSGFLSTTAPRPYGLLFVISSSPSLSLSLFVISWCNVHRMAAAHTMVGLILLEGQRPSRARWRRIPKSKSNVRVQRKRARATRARYLGEVRPG
jgi:hypothetical protein